MLLDIYGSDSLNFVELNISGNADCFQQCDKDSYYIDTELFNLFSECFEKSNNLYDYMGPNKYNYRNIVVLLNELKNNLLLLNEITSASHFTQFIQSKFLGASFLKEIEKQEPDLSKNWEQLKTKIENVNQKLIDIINQCINEDRILWLIGY